MPDYCDVFRCARVVGGGELAAHPLDGVEYLIYDDVLLDEPGPRLVLDPSEPAVAVMAIYGSFCVRLFHGDRTPLTYLTPRDGPPVIDHLADFQLWVDADEDAALLADPDWAAAFGEEVARELRDDGGSLFGRPVADEAAWRRLHARVRDRIPDGAVATLLTAAQDAFIVGDRRFEPVPEDPRAWAEIAATTGFESPGRLMAAVLGRPLPRSP
ncbi:MAG: hypothetical protein KF729_09720 [Sandaracinaceae bacterium]|nr:hypothetical protein [Sandaracinaceae bacterium]